VSQRSSLVGETSTPRRWRSLVTRSRESGVSCDSHTRDRSRRALE
jgi:hypothetical protein